MRSETERVVIYDRTYVDSQVTAEGVDEVEVKLGGKDKMLFSTTKTTHIYTQKEVWEIQDHAYESQEYKTIHVSHNNTRPKYKTTDHES